MMDGAIDYRGYTDLQLQEALQSIDRVKFPLNYSRLTLEMQRRRLNANPTVPSPSGVARDPVWHQHSAAETIGLCTTVPLWKYVVLFAIAFYVGAMLLGSIFEYFELKRSSSVGSVITFLGAMLVGRRFVAQHGRIFTSKEAHRLMLYCLLTLVPLEALVVFFHPDLQNKLPPIGLLASLVVAIALNALVVWIAFRFIARRDMQNRLKKSASGAA